MIESIKKVNHPLTVIIIFAALAEVLSTVAIGSTEADLQVFFLWFIILFPTLLIILFFVTLNFNSRVIYMRGETEHEKDFKKTTTIALFSDEKLDEVDLERSNIVEIKERVKAVIKLSETSTPAKAKEEALLSKANLFFINLINKLGQLVDKNFLEGVKFAIHTPELFWIEFKLSKNKLKIPRRPYEYDHEYGIIIKLTSNTENEIYLEAVGKNIKERNEEVFAEKVYQHINTIIISYLEKQK